MLLLLSRHSGGFGDGGGSSSGVDIDGDGIGGGYIGSGDSVGGAWWWCLLGKLSDQHRAVRSSHDATYI